MRTVKALKIGSKVWTKDAVKEQIKTDENALFAALIRVYNGQTESEKMISETTEDNGVGFTGADANFLSSLAEQYLRRKYLSEKQKTYLRRKMPKYANQIFNGMLHRYEDKIFRLPVTPSNDN